MVWCVAVWSDQTVIHFLVHLATLGIEFAEPLKFTPEGVGPDYIARSQLFFWRSLAFVGLLAINLGLIHLLASQWTQGPRRRLIWAGLLVLGMVLLGACPIWVYTSGLYAVSPYTAEALHLKRSYHEVPALLVIVVLVTAATRRVVQTLDRPARPVEIDWHRHKPSYYHQRRLVMVVLIVAVVAGAVIDAMNMQFGPIGPGWWFWISAYLPNYFVAAVALLATQRLIRGPYRPVDLPMAGPPELNPAQFCAIWLAYFAAALFGVPTLACFSFAVWLGPWYALPWP